MRKCSSVVRSSVSLAAVAAAAMFSPSAFAQAADGAQTTPSDDPAPTTESQTQGTPDDSGVDADT